MFKNKRVLGLITARGGSKGLPGKNTKDIAGKPLVQWSVEQGIECQLFDRFMISTDDPEIARIAVSAGCEAPFLRPSCLAGDEAKSIDVINHAIDWLQSDGQSFDYLVLLEPTSPLRAHGDIERALLLLHENADAESVVSVAESKSSHPEFTVKVGSDGFLMPYLNDFASKRRQDVAPAYYFDGTVYASTVMGLRKYSGFYHEKTIGLKLSAWQAYEIDDYCDFLVVEALLRARQEQRI